MSTPLSEPLIPKKEEAIVPTAATYEPPAVVTTGLEGPGLAAPVVEEAGLEEPAAAAPVVEEPVAEEPVAEEPEAASELEAGLEEPVPGEVVPEIPIDVPIQLTAEQQKMLSDYDEFVKEYPTKLPITDVFNEINRLWPDLNTNTNGNDEYKEKERLDSFAILFNENSDMDKFLENPLINHLNTTLTSKENLYYFLTKVLYFSSLTSFNIETKTIDISPIKNQLGVDISRNKSTTFINNISLESLDIGSDYFGNVDNFNRNLITLKDILDSLNIINIIDLCCIQQIIQFVSDTILLQLLSYDIQQNGGDHSVNIVINSEEKYVEYSITSKLIDSSYPEMPVWGTYKGVFKINLEDNSYSLKSSLERMNQQLLDGYNEFVKANPKKLPDSEIFQEIFRHYQDLKAKEDVFINQILNDPKNEAAEINLMSQEDNPLEQEGGEPPERQEAAEINLMGEEDELLKRQRELSEIDSMGEEDELLKQQQELQHQQEQHEAAEIDSMEKEESLTKSINKERSKAKAEAIYMVKSKLGLDNLNTFFVLDNECKQFYERLKNWNVDEWDPFNNENQLIVNSNNSEENSITFILKGTKSLSDFFTSVLYCQVNTWFNDNNLNFTTLLKKQLGKDLERNIMKMNNSSQFINTATFLAVKDIDKRVDLFNNIIIGKSPCIIEQNDINKIDLCMIQQITQYIGDLIIMKQFSEKRFMINAASHNESFEITRKKKYFEINFGGPLRISIDIPHDYIDMEEVVEWGEYKGKLKLFLNSIGNNDAYECDITIIRHEEPEVIEEDSMYQRLTTIRRTEQSLANQPSTSRIGNMARGAMEYATDNPVTRYAYNNPATAATGVGTAAILAAGLGTAVLLGLLEGKSKKRLRNKRKHKKTIRKKNHRKNKNTKRKYKKSKKQRKTKKNVKETVKEYVKESVKENS